MAEPLVVNAQITISADELRFTFARSSGPGGQNVNKLNTKACLRWNCSRSNALPIAVRDRFVARYANRLNEGGELVIASEQSREQARNIRDCRERLRAMILSVVSTPKRRKKTSPTRRAIERRLDAKRRRAQKKRDRQSPRFD